MSQAEEHRVLMLRFLAEADSALLKARDRRVTGDLDDAAFQLRLAASATKQAEEHQRAMVRARLAEGAVRCVG